MTTNRQRRYETELAALREENARLRAGLLAVTVQQKVRGEDGSEMAVENPAPVEDTVRIQRDALIEAFCAVLPSDDDRRSWARGCLIDGMVPSIANHRAREAEYEARRTLDQACAFLSRLRWHLRLPPGIPSLDDAPDVARVSMEYAQLQGATWMKEAVCARFDGEGAIEAQLDPGAVCAAARPKEPE